MTIEALFYAMLVLNLASELFFHFHEKRYERDLHKKVIPEIAPYAPENYNWQRERDYKKSRRNFGLFSSIISFALTLVIFLSGSFTSIMKMISQTWQTPFWQGFWFTFLFVIAYSLYSIPFAWYSSFVIEEKFGFNRKTSLTFWKDQLTSTCLGLAMAPPLMGLANTLAGRPFGIPLIFITIILFSMGISFIFPVIIMPLFYRIVPLEEGELKEKVNQLISKTGLPVKGVFKADQSRRSSHANAMVAGMGRSKKIILFDTLLDRMSLPQVLGVLAHELGHWSKKHTPKLLLAGTAEQAFLFMVVWAMWNSPFSASVFGMENMTLPRLLVVIFIVSSLLGLFISPLESWLSRKYEFEADEYAALYTHASSFREALSSLATNDLAWIPPSPLYSTWFSSHPSIPERILSLSGYEKNEVYTEKKKEE